MEAGSTRLDSQIGLATGEGLMADAMFLSAWEMESSQSETEVRE